MKKNECIFREWKIPRLQKVLRIMKLTVFLLLLSVISVFASKSYSQTQVLNLDMKNSTVKEVLRNIEKQSEFVFMYSEKLIDVNCEVSVNMRNQKINEVLDELFAGTDVRYKVKDRFVLLTTPEVTGSDLLAQQQKSVSGKVTDAGGQPLPGVTVVVKGTIQGTVTNADGSYSITNIPVDATLQFSFVGMKTMEVVVGNQANINVVMEEETIGLEEVVAIGYSAKQRSQISSSIAVVSQEKLNVVTSNNISNLLQGHAAGVIVSRESGDPGAAQTIIIRGSSSITAGSQPLTVVDGIIGGSANPNDIESITVLKDAAATGLYGSRAANGVIVITTKSGWEGKTEINASAKVGFNNVTYGNFRMMDSQELYDYQRMFFDPDDFVRERPESLLSQNTNWLDLAYRTGQTQEYEVSVAGGNKNTKFYLSGNFYSEEGTLKHTGIENYNLRANITHIINPKLKLNLKFNAAIGSSESEASEALGRSGATYAALVNMPWDNPFNSDRTIKKGTESDWIGRDKNNFLYDWQYNFDEGRSESVHSDLNLDYTIIPDLTFSTYNRVSISNSFSNLYYDKRSIPGKGIGSLRNSNGYSRGLITSNRLKYDKNFNDHLLSALIVAEAQKSYSDSNGTYGEGFVNGISVMSAASKVISGSGSKSEAGFTKALAQIDYNYNNRYFFVGSLINEASSLFGANYRSANFFTLGTSWILTNEKFMSNLGDINLLKIKASYGSVGNANIPNYRSLQLYSFTTQYNSNPGSFPSQMANPDLTWEKAKMANFGMEVKIFQRINLEVDFYSKESSGLLLNVQVPLTSGFESTLRNEGAVRNRGMELTLSTNNLQGALQWNTDFNIAFNRNKVLRLDERENDIIVGDQIISIGEDMNTWYLRKWLGVDPENGDPLWEQVTEDANGNEVRTPTNSFSSAPLQKIGGMSPDFTGGINNTLIYKGFSLNAFFNFVVGNKILHRMRYTLDNDGFYDRYNSMALADGWSRWQTAGDIATHPKPVLGGNMNSNQMSSRYLEDGSYLRLRNITLSYNLPSIFLQDIKLSSVRIFVSGDNLWTLTNYSGRDPEVIVGPVGGGGETRYSSSGDYPISKKILFGLNIKF